MTSTQGQKIARLGLRFFSNASLYGIGSFVVKMGSFLVLPLYWNVLTPEDFGLIAISQILAVFLDSILDFGMSGSLQRHYYEWQPEDRKKHLAAIWTFSFVFSLFVCLLMTLGAGLLHRLFQVPIGKELIYFGIWIAFLQNMDVLPFSLCRIREQLKLYSMLTIGQFFVQTISTLVFLYVFKLGYWGFLLGNLLGSFVYGTVGLIMIWKEIEFPWQWKHLKGPLTYAFPTLPAALLEGSGSVLDRYFLQRYIGLHDLGLYSLSRQFGQAYNFFLSMLKNSWVPLIYRITSERADAPQVLSRLSTYYLVILVAPGLLISVLARDAILLLNKPDYFGIVDYIPSFIVAYLIMGFGNIHGRGIDLAKKTQYYWTIYAVQFVANIGFLAWWAPLYGAWGAVAALIAANLCREITQVGLAYYFYPRKMDIRAILITLTLQWSAYWICSWLRLESLWLDMIVKTLIVGISTGLNLLLVFGYRGAQKFLDFACKRLQRR